MRHVWLALSAAAMLAGCSKKPVVDECFDEFIQEFTLSIPGWVQEVMLCKAELEKQPSPDAYRFATITTHVEYSEGEYYVEQTNSYYKLETGERGEDDERFCYAVVPFEEVIVQRFEADELVTEVFVGDEKVATLNHHPEMLQFGEGRLGDPRWQDKDLQGVEDTDFKLRCAATTRKYTPHEKTSACMAVEPVKSCKAVRAMMPIRQEGQTRFGLLTGKTTRLEMGPVGSLVDKSTWEMESDEAK